MMKAGLRAVRLYEDVGRRSPISCQVNRDCPVGFGTHDAICVCADRPLFWLQRFVVVEVVYRGMGSWRWQSSGAGISRVTLQVV